MTTGISAADRATTIRTAIAEDTLPEDLVSPGHVFPFRPARAGSWCAPVRPKAPWTWPAWRV